MTCRHAYRVPHAGGGWTCPECGQFLSMVQVEPVTPTTGRWGEAVGWIAVLGFAALAWFATGCTPEREPLPPVVIESDTGACCDLPVRMCAFQSHAQPCDPCPGGAEFDAAGRRAK